MSTPATADATAPVSSQQLVTGLIGLMVGSFAVNAMPHLFQGLSGDAFQTPFGAESSAAVNVAWGAANLMLAGGVAYFSRERIPSPAYAVGAGVGVLGTSLSLLAVFA